MKQRVILYADEGKILTDGEVYGKQIFLGGDRNAEEFYEIADKEYDEIMEKSLEEDLNAK